MQSRFELWKKEQEYLRGVYEETPEFLTPKPFVEGPDFLRQFGIEIPHQETFPYGFIKLWPQDFIVEEIGQTGRLQSITREDSEALSIDQDDAKTIYATLVKCNISTLEAMDDISNMLGVDRSAVGYAGLKDKVAITGQLVSFRRTSLESVQQLISPNFFLKDIHIGKGVIANGDLQGNQFTILVRTEGEIAFDLVREQIKQIGQQGFYNYFYLQRFGVPRLNRAVLGIDILRGDYKGALYHLFTISGEREVLLYQRIRDQIREIFGNWEAMREILSQIPVGFQYELTMLEHLIQQPEDFVGALREVEGQVMMWVQAVSSLLFNKKLSQYYKEGRIPPAQLPVFLSNDQSDWSYYKTFLQELDIWPPPLFNLKPFPQIRLDTKFVPTMAHVDVKQVQQFPEGVILQFVLPKGAYATTFLSQLFQLGAGFVSEKIKREPVDTKKILGEQSSADTVSYFTPVIKSRTPDEVE